MRFRKYFVIRLFLAISLVASLQAHVCGEDAIRVFKAKNVSIGELESALRRLMNDGESDIRMTSVAQSNSLVLVGKGDTIDVIMETLGRLDEAPSMVRVSVFVIQPQGVFDLEELDGPVEEVRENIKRLAEQSKVKVTSRFRLVAIDSQKTSVQSGRSKAMANKPKIPAAMERRAENDERMRAQIKAIQARSKSYNYTDVGSIVSVVSRVAGERITLDVSWEHSDVETGDDDGFPAQPTKARAETVISLEDGHAALIQGVTDLELSKEWMLVVGAEKL